MLDFTASQGLSQLTFPGPQAGHQEGSDREDASSVEQISRPGDGGEINTTIKHEASLQDWQERVCWDTLPLVLPALLPRRAFWSLVHKDNQGRWCSVHVPSPHVLCGAN